ncbi:MAG: hypothetical protein ACE5HC_13680 [Candidatus Binatia bacterium]
MRDKLPHTLWRLSKDNRVLGLTGGGTIRYMVTQIIRKHDRGHVLIGPLLATLGVVACMIR